ncbi:MAG: M23 family metallopeptidase [Gemmatimonadales bacterium]
MSQRRWTVMVVPHGEGTSRSVAVNATFLKVVLGVSSFVLLVLLAASFGVVNRAVDIARSQRLERENRALSDELTRVNRHLGTLSDTIAVISQRDEQVRLVAGLEPLNDDVRRVGVGGPAGAWPERDRLLADGGTNGREALRTVANLDELTRRANLVSASLSEAADSLRAHEVRLAATPSIMPTIGFLSSNFSLIRYHPILHYGRPHEGIDISAPYGTPIIAAAAGRITKIGWENGYGLTVEIDHGYGVTTRYAHQSRTEPRLRVGQQVKRGDRIGFVGSTGLATGPHLHYEVRIDGRATDPLKFVMPNAIAD